MAETPTSIQHQQMAAQHVAHKPVHCAVLTISDTRTMQNDAGGALIGRLLTEAGHVVAVRSIVPDEPKQIQSTIQQWLTGVGVDNSGIRAILTTGGTGIAKRDTTIDVARRLMTVELPGFGELFRMLSFEAIGSAAMLSRAVAGLVTSSAQTDTLLFCMPGSPDAVELAMTRLIVPQLAHLIWERQR
jgi:molybdenum cofactor biosynthesis protein B